MKAYQNDESAMSPVIGVIILICLLFVAAISVGSVLYVHYSEPEAPPMANLDVSNGDSKALKISHRGGDSLDLDKKIRILVVGEKGTYELSSLSKDELNTGEEIEIDLIDEDGNPIGDFEVGDTVTVKVIDSKDTVLIEEEVTFTEDPYPESEDDSEEDEDESEDVNETIEEELINITGNYVILTDSNGNPLSDGLVKYYENGWEEIGETDTSGTVAIPWENGTYTFQMTYNDASQEITQNIAANGVVEFQTTLVNITLSNSTGSVIQTNSSTAQYYSDSWYDFGTTINGVSQKELLPLNYTFRVYHANTSMEKEQNVSQSNDVNFQIEEEIVTIEGNHVLLIDSNGNPLSGGFVKYYDRGWKELGETATNGAVEIPMDTGTYTFRMTYNYASYDIRQNIATDGVVEFQTDLVTVSLLDSEGSVIDTDSSTVKYYSGGWRSFGTTTDGVVQKELLPKSYTFRMYYADASIDKAQNVAADTAVDFQTTLVSVTLLDSEGSVIDTDSSTVKYYSGGWRSFGTTTNGVVQKELLPKSYTFRMYYADASIDKAQNVAADTAVDFQTALVSVTLLDSEGSVIDTDSSTVKYYSGGWRSFGTTTNGVVQKELLPKSYTFRMYYADASIDKAQNVAADTAVDFQTTLVSVTLLDSEGSVIDTDSSTVKYYSGGWRSFGTTTDGVVQKELLPKSYTFRLTYNYKSKDMSQNVASDQMVEMETGKVVSSSNTCSYYYSGGWRTFTEGMEMMPGSYTFRFSDGTPNKSIKIAAGETTDLSDYV